jgi:hypothetical protein
MPTPAVAKQPMAIFRQAKIKTSGRLSAVSRHNSRANPPSNANPAKAGENQVLVGSGIPASDVEALLATVPGKRRKNGVLALEFVLTASPEFFEGKSPEEVRQWADTATAWAKAEYGAENVASVVLHLDEKTPHLHGLAVPIRDEPRKKGASRRIDASRFGGRQNLTRMQDSHAEAMAPLGLARGKRGSKATHQAVATFYATTAQAETVAREIIAGGVALHSELVAEAGREMTNAQAHTDKAILTRYAVEQLRTEALQFKADAERVRAEAVRALAEARKAKAKAEGERNKATAEYAKAVAVARATTTKAKALGGRMAAAEQAEAASIAAAASAMRGKVAERLGSKAEAFAPRKVGLAHSVAERLRQFREWVSRRQRRNAVPKEVRQYWRAVARARLGIWDEAGTLWEELPELKARADEAMKARFGRDWEARRQAERVALAEQPREIRNAVFEQGKADRKQREQAKAWREQAKPSNGGAVARTVKQATPYDGLPGRGNAKPPATVIARPKPPTRGTDWER